jgi:hypothetical protein
LNLCVLQHAAKLCSACGSEVAGREGRVSRYRRERTNRPLQGAPRPWVVDPTCGAARRSPPALWDRESGLKAGRAPQGPKSWECEDRTECRRTMTRTTQQHLGSSTAARRRVRPCLTVRAPTQRPALGMRKMMPTASFAEQHRRRDERSPDRRAHGRHAPTPQKADRPRERRVRPEL